MGNWDGTNLVQSSLARFLPFRKLGGLIFGGGNHHRKVPFLTTVERLFNMILKRIGVLCMRMAVYECLVLTSFHMLWNVKNSTNGALA